MAKPRTPARSTRGTLPRPPSPLRITLGIDEAGRGPSVGPMTMAAVALDSRNAAALTRAGLCDSKSYGAGDEAHARYETELGPITGGGYANAATRRWLRAYVVRYGRLPDETRLTWPHPYVEDLIGNVRPPGPQAELF